MKFEFIDPVCVPVIFSTGLARIENLGGVFLYTFINAQDGEKIVTARLAILTSAIPHAQRLTAAEMRKLTAVDLGCASARH